ncbi:MAG: Veg family protein [Bacilli bacterium]|nr:Veg family protein [Bacilli bacterium]
MNINIIKNRIISLKDYKLKIRINLGRNKYEYLEGKIDKIHSNLFTVTTNKGIKSFTYSDIITKAVIINKFD